MEGTFSARIKAPQFEGITEWFNSKPLSLDKLGGKAVLLDFWTYSCVNCLRALPHVKKWHEKYSKKGLVVIGVASPEFGFEGEPANVKEAIRALGIKYPVALDAKQRTWEAYGNHYWPAQFLIDKDGFISYVHFGEGDYSQTEAAIQVALGAKMKAEKEEFPAYMFDQSPETYAGFGKSFGLGSGLVCDRDGCNVYVDPGSHAMNTIYPHGRWVQEKEYIELDRVPGRLSYRFNAREVNLVMAPVGKEAKAEIYVDEKKTGDIVIDGPRMYNVFTDKKYGERELALIFSGKVRVYSFTFG